MGMNPSGPTLRWQDETNDFVLDEYEIVRVVTPHWSGDTLRIGCTSVTREASDKLVEKFGRKL